MVVLTVFSLKRFQRAARVLSVLLVVGLPAGLLVGGAQPVAVGLIAAPWDKLAHAVVYAVLACAIGYASCLRGRAAMLVGMAGALAVGVLDEWHQMSLPGRAAGLDDLLADALGAALGCVVLGMRAQLRNWVGSHLDQ